MKKLLKEFATLLFIVLIAVVYYFYTPKSAFNLHKRINLSNPALLNEERTKLSKDLEEYLASGLPKDPGKTPTILHLFLGNQRKLLDLRFNQAIDEIKKTKVEPGKIRVWSLMNMGVVVKTDSKTIAFDIADMPLSTTQKKLVDIVDVILVTHGDSDHYDPALLKKALEQGKTVIFPENFGFMYNKNFSNIFKLKDGESVNLEELKVTAFQTDHRGDGNFLEPNAWYLVETDKFKLLHTGDGRDFKNKSEKEALKYKEIDIFLCNVKIHPYDIRDVKPKVVVSLHLYKFIHNREELEQSTFNYAINQYRQYLKDLNDIEKIYLFPGESFIYPMEIEKN